MRQGSVKITLVPLLKQHLEERQKKNAERRSLSTRKVFYPSQIHGCARSLAFQFLGATKTSYKKLIIELRADMGEMAHTLYQQYLEKIPDIKFIREVPIREKYLLLRGKCDGVFYLEGKKYVLEIKTVDSEKWEKLTKIYPYHKPQANLYTGLTGAEGCLFWYVSTDFKHMPKEFYLPFDQGLYTNTRNIVMDVISNVRKKSLPDKDKFHCRFCEYTLVCDEDPTELLKSDIF